MLSTFTYNLKLAKLFGVNTSILFSYINDIQENNIDTDVTISREEVLSKTGLDEKSQEESEFVLKKSNLITVKEFKNNNSKYYCKVNKELLIKVMTSSTPSEELPVENVAQLVRTIKPKIDKKAIIKNNLK